ncbi:MAG: hypothetical protein JWN12_678 [Candidatus Saccharibacteria bacterium]|nr:hypothetical protein [Candidatus Saccharibacteria bacterium]
MSEQSLPSSQEPQPNPYSEEALNNKWDKNRPTAEDPIMFRTEDAVKSVSFQQVEGEALRGIVEGYFYNEQGEKVNLISPNRQSAEKAGWDTDTQGYMKVPEFAVKKPESAPIAPEVKSALLTDAQEDIADEAIEDVLGLEDPSEIDRKYTSYEIKAMREAARRIVDQEIPTLPNPGGMITGKPAPEATPSNDLETQFQVAEAKFNELKDSISSDKDRAAAWQYAISINYAERDSALKKLTYGFDQGFLREYTAAANTYLDLRKRIDQTKG